MSRGREFLAAGVATSVLLAGCASEAKKGYEGVPTPAPVAVQEAIGHWAVRGVFIVPYGIDFPDGSSVERSFAGVFPDSGSSEINLGCSPVGAQVNMEIAMLYATDKDGNLIQFPPPDSVDKIKTPYSNIGPSTVQCVRFDSGDAFNKHGIPEVGVFDGKPRSFQIQEAA